MIGGRVFNASKAASTLKKAGFPEVANLGSWRRIQSLLS